MPRAALLLVVGFLSAGTLSFEILLVRAFGIAHFHHFAYLAVGVAMLGLGAGGVAAALLLRMAEARRGVAIAWAAVACAMALVGSPAIALRLPLDATRLAWDPGQWALFGLLEVVLAAPFVAGGLAILLGMAAEEERRGLVYAASFAGAGLGAGASLAALGVLLPERALALPALLTAPGAIAAAFLVAPRDIVARSACTLAALAGAAVIVAPPWRLPVSPYKGLPQVEAYPGARRAAESASPVGWLVAVDASAFRYAPGLSLGYGGGFPVQRALFVDGSLAGAAVIEPSQDSLWLALASELPASLPYAMRAMERVLVVGAGEGAEVAAARAHGAREITAVELHPGLARAARTGGRAAAPAPGTGRLSDVRWEAGDARGYLARTTSRFDLIALPAGGALGAAAGGVHALDEDFLHTVEAYRIFLDRLAPNGVLSITRWLVGPPREPVRVVLTASEALRSVDPQAPARGLVVMRSWATATVLAKPSGFTDGEIARLREWSAARSFDIDWAPGSTVPPPEPFNLVEDPVLFRAARAGSAGPREAAAFAASYPFLVTPVTDARPYARRFLRASSLPRLIRSGSGAWLPFAEWGYVAVLATLALSIVAASVLLLVPLAARARRSPGPAAAAPRGPPLAYFALIGFGYLAAEIAVIQQLHLLLGHPVYAVTAALTAVLLCSGAGSLWSDRIAKGRARSTGAALALLLAVAALALLAIVHRVQPAPLAARAAIALLAVAPLAFLMGAPFPLGLRSLDAGAGGGARARIAPVASAWAVNGFASTVAAPLSALIALEWGSQALLLSAAAAYAGAALLVPPGSR